MHNENRKTRNSYKHNRYKRCQKPLIPLNIHPVTILRNFFRFMSRLCLPYAMTVVVIVSITILMHNPLWLYSNR